MEQWQLVRQFNMDVDRLLEGKEIEEAKMSEYREMIDIARNVMNIDFNTANQFRQKLLCSLLKKYNKERSTHCDHYEEILEDDLQRVAGGSNNLSHGVGCSKCECPLMSCDIHGPMCKECGHPRDNHS